MQLFPRIVTEPRMWHCAGAAILYALLFTGTLFADPPNQRYGIVSHWDGEVSAAFNDLGVGLLRTPCDWAEMEPAPGYFTWDCSDARIYGATAAGAKVLLTAQCTPAWARSGGGCSTMPSNLQDWSDFVSHFVDRYKGLNVVLGIYNEPNLVGISSSNYCTLFNAASIARNFVSGSFVLAGPETSWHAYGDGYFSSVMSCMRERLQATPSDVITVHWYDDSPVAFGTYLDAMRSISGVNNDIWMSEVGYVGYDTTYQSNGYFARMAEMETLALTRPWLKNIVFYQLYDEVSPYVPWGILDQNHNPRPAYYTFKDLVRDQAGLSSGTLHADRYLFQNQQVDSANGDWHLYYQSDGNLVLYDYSWSPLWASNTAGTTPGFAVMQGDGNLVVYDGDGVARYASDTAGHPGGYAVVEDKGRFVIFDSQGQPLRRLY